ncbi:MULTISPECIES: hypothetical protein [Natrialbaceae]|uniref:Uncharacterized protein n=1 Tax=Natrialba asiatica (strain ATCC 700177 / DSM 12278 / JCM 9576 / FERM P-10747 / NBRC 102637 / 172P1) TaxID=29540 RepID=M0AF39_NATA1|nr:hypothetical protein [Natrialba asiatica]ELY97375.1 hypothetical protein C481_20021 [Natrialba asiatica DSM 12278]
MPDDVSCVIVHGYDEIHGYGGRAMLVALQSGETRVADQGSFACSFGERDCP